MLLPSLPRRQVGFSLIELAIVLVVVALLSGGLLMSLSGQQDRVLQKEAEDQQALIRETLLGFAITYGRLPCPADPALNSAAGGNEALQQCTPAPHRASCAAGDQQCALKAGVLPWRTLGLKEIDTWGNRITYLASYDFADPLSAAEIAAGRRSRIEMTTEGNLTIQDGAGNNVALAIPAAYIMHGKRYAGAYQTDGSQLGGAAGDEAENADGANNQILISHLPTESFDDLVAWIVPTVLKSRLVAVGKLP